MTRCTVAAGIVLACCGCRSSEPPAGDAPQGAAAAAPAVLATEIPFAAPRHEALPRAVAGVSLGMSRSDAEDRLGHLACHENKAGYLVCNGDNEHLGDARHVEIYVSHDQVISVSYEGLVPTSAGDALNQLIERYGSPSLSGVRQRDTSGRVHEIYGWKDDVSLYSVRFVWRNAESESPELVGIVTAIWDRNGYQQWEAETRQREGPSEGNEQPRERI